MEIIFKNEEDRKKHFIFMCKICSEIAPDPAKGLKQAPGSPAERAFTHWALSPPLACIPPPAFKIPASAPGQPSFLWSTKIQTETVILHSWLMPSMHSN